MADVDLLDESTNQKLLLDEKKRSSLDHMKIESPHVTESHKLESSPSYLPVEDSPVKITNKSSIVDVDVIDQH